MFKGETIYLFIKGKDLNWFDIAFDQKSGISTLKCHSKALEKVFNLERILFPPSARIMHGHLFQMFDGVGDPTAKNLDDKRLEGIERPEHVHMFQRKNLILGGSLLFSRSLNVFFPVSRKMHFEQAAKAHGGNRRKSFFYYHFHVFATREAQIWCQKNSSASSSACFFP